MMMGFPVRPDPGQRVRNDNVMENYRQHQATSEMLAGQARKTGSEHCVVANWSSADDTLSGCALNVSENKLCCILVTQMQLGKVHHGAVLHGKVVADAIYTGGVYFVVEDAAGDLVKVGVYNDTRSTHATAARMFRTGQTVSIAEPYYKLGSEGQPFVRVNKPTSIKNDGSTPGPDADAWDQQAKQALRTDKAKAAYTCWTLALKREVATQATGVLLTNRAAAYLQSGKYGEAARDCMAALCVDPTSAKAGFRLVQALSGLEMHGTASQYARSFEQRWPDISASFKPYTRGRGRANEEQAALDSMWWEADAVMQTLTRQACGTERGQDSTWEDLKTRGNERFRTGDFDGAVKLYSEAMEAVHNKHELGRLLCNRAAAATHEGNFACAVVDATAALVLDPGHGKSWYRRALALCELGLFEKAAVACKHGLRVLREQGMNASDFEALERKICEQRTRAPKKQDKTSTAQHKGRLEAHVNMVKCKDVMDREQLAALNAVFASMGMTGIADELGMKPPALPAFHLEVKKHSAWPKGVDVKWAKEYLSFCFQQSRFLPHTLESQICHPSYTVPTPHLAKRANRSTRRLEWLCSVSARAGDIMPEDPLERLTYFESSRRAFSNQSYRAEILTRGTVHVAVGFVDLGVLLCCKFAQGGDARAGALEFVGVELSVFAVAKSLVVWQMAADAGGNLEAATAILQVWFSATWNLGTVDAFRHAVAAVRENSAAMYGDNDAVSALLEHWAQCKGVPLKHARAQWAETVTLDGCNIGHLVHKTDRLRMIAYELTGDVFVDVASELTGSICWWDCPDGTPPSEHDQTFFSVLDLSKVMEEAAGEQGLFPACEEFLRRRVRNLIARAAAGEVVVRAMVGNVEALVPQIAALHPCTMSWSNVSDYFQQSQFHAIARACSVHGNTVHFAYTMNWTTDVMGAYVIDFHDAEERRAIIAQGYQMLQKVYQVHGLQRTFRLPPPENPMNIADYTLVFVWYKKWVDTFLAAARHAGAVNPGNAEPVVYNPLTKTGNTTVFLVWTYDEDVVFARV